jgi:hypothetical protein
MQALLAHHVVEEEVRKDPLPHEAALEVGEHAEDRVDLPGVGQFLQLLRVDHALRLHGSSSQTGGAAGASPTAPRSIRRNRFASYSFTSPTCV